MRLLLLAAVVAVSWWLAMEGVIHPWLAFVFPAGWIAFDSWYEVRKIFRNRRDPRYGFRFGWFLAGLGITVISIGLMIFSYQVWGE